MTPEQCKAMRIPDLGVAILRRLAVLGEQWRNGWSRRAIRRRRPRPAQQQLQGHHRSWVGDRAVSRPTETLRRVQAAAQLNIELHPRLRAGRVEATFRAGDTDSAIRDALA